MVGGYMNKVLRIDLTHNEISNQVFSEDILRNYLGGSGLGARILYDETSEKTDPLGPDNVLIYMTGPITATPAPNFGRHEVIAKSPLTGRYGEANSGGKWGTMLKMAGFDGIVFTGKAPKPVYVWINNGSVEIRDAVHVWGKDTFETDEILRGETNPKAVTSCIGPAGEKLVRIAGIMHDGPEARAAARCGLGAVMGSKNLKAVMVYGTMKPEVSNIEALRQSIKELAPMIVKNTTFQRNFGTSGFVPVCEEIGDLPVKNWKEGSFKEGAAKISGQRMAETFGTKKYYCQGCIIGCGKTVKIDEGPFKMAQSAAPEYETLGTLGSSCLVDNLEAVAKANELCNRYGLDTISAGGAISFAMELYEHGLITKQQCGMELNWGDGAALVEMVRKIAMREDIGWLLGEGSARAADIIGGRACEFAIHVKGMEFPAHDPRAKFSMALSYATSERGACHLSGYTYAFEAGSAMPELGYPETLERFTEEGKDEMVVKFQNMVAALESLIACRFIVVGLKAVTIKTMVEWLNAITGWNYTKEEFLTTGERIVNLKRMYNAKCGASRKDDMLPIRIMLHPRPDGGSAKQLPNLGKMLDSYYSYRGWSEIGIPLQETLERLGLD